MIGVFDLIGTMGSGWLSDRYDNRWLLAIYYGFRGLALIWLMESNAMLGAMSAFAMLYVAGLHLDRSADGEIDGRRVWAGDGSGDLRLDFCGPSAWR